MLLRAVTAALLAASLTGCADLPDRPRAAPAAPSTPLALPPPSAVQTRSADAAERLRQSEAGLLLLAAIDAHGGLARWYGNGPLHFRYAYDRLDGNAPLDTEQTVDTWSARARHTVLSDSSTESPVAFGWTGREAWVLPAGAELPTNARFWALTPYYFVGMPFVLADPGVNLERAGQMEAEGRTYDLLRATFDAGTGDAPDDYYYLLLDPETRQVGGVRYVVSYPGFFPEGGATPEKLMLYDGAQTASGITFQEGFRSFAWTDAGMGEPSARGTLAAVRFLPDTPDALFDVPEGAQVLDGM